MGRRLQLGNLGIGIDIFCLGHFRNNCDNGQLYLFMIYLANSLLSYDISSKGGGYLGLQPIDSRRASL